MIYITEMEIRNAKSCDAVAINALIACHAEIDKMLFRSVADIYEYLQTFTVAVEGDNIVGCCALQVVWDGLAEIKSLAVNVDYFGRGIGKQLVAASIENARTLGLKKIFTLTLEPGFFENSGFRIVNKNTLPMKVWSDCAKCSKQDNCDETALVFEL